MEERITKEQHKSIMLAELSKGLIVSMATNEHVACSLARHEEDFLDAAVWAAENLIKKLDAIQHAGPRPRGW